MEENDKHVPHTPCVSMKNHRDITILPTSTLVMYKCNQVIILLKNIIIPWMYLWSINDSLSQLLHIPVGHWLRVGQPSSKYLQANAVRY